MSKKLILKYEDDKIIKVLIFAVLTFNHVVCYNVRKESRSGT